MIVTAQPNVWRRFWEKGGWWRALLLVVAYYALYQGVPLIFAPLFEAAGATDAAATVWIFTVIPIALGGVVLVVFAWSLGWLRELFGPQPIRGRGWMWIAVAVVLVFNILHFATIDYASAGTGVVVAWLVAGLCIGFAEETLTRGYPTTSTVATLSGLGNPAVIIVGLLLLLFIRGQVPSSSATDAFGAPAQLR